jgi:hypothetical protein
MENSISHGHELFHELWLYSAPDMSRVPVWYKLVAEVTRNKAL